MIRRQTRWWGRVSLVLMLACTFLVRPNQTTNGGVLHIERGLARGGVFSWAGSTAQGTKLNLSRDLVALGIASQNLAPNQPMLDARPLFDAAIGYIRSHSISALTLDKGDYYFLTSDDPTAYLNIVQLSNLTIDLAGSTIFFQMPFLKGFSISTCQNITLTNFVFDFMTPPYTEVALTSVDPNARTLSYSTQPNWADPVTFNNVTTPTGTPVLWAVIFRNGEILPGTSRMQVSPAIANNVLPLAPDTTPWSQAGTLSTFQPGDTIVVTERGGSPAVAVANSDSISISNGTISRASVNSVGLQQTSNFIVENIHVVPHPGDLVSSCGGGIMSDHSGPNNRISNCFVTGTLDDAIEFDSNDVAEVTAFDPNVPNQVTVQRNEFVHFPNGTAVNFVDPGTGSELTGATIVSQDPPDSPTPPANGLVQLTLNQNLPGSLASGFGMVYAGDAARGGGTIIEHNDIPEVPFGGGIALFGSSGVTIQDNKIGNTSNAGVLVFQERGSFPGPPSHDVMILDNIINGSLGPMASGSGTQVATGAITVNSIGVNGQFFTSTPNTNISMIDNHILNSGRSGIWAGEINGGVIQGNKIKHSDSHPELPVFGVDPAVAAQLMQDFTEPVVVFQSQNVTISNQ
jgi:hypothetical protein